jgi:O-antigen ligase
MEFEQDVSNIARAEQMDSLLAGWVESPFLGNGLGTSSSILRNEDLPWAYELSYLALIFHTGLLGLVIYVSAISWIFAASARLMIAHNMSKPMFLPLLTGLACFLIANATNPYLSTFDYLWTIFLPLAAVNAFRVGRISIS